LFFSCNQFLKRIRRINLRIRWSRKVNDQITEKIEIKKYKQAKIKIENSLKDNKKQFKKIVPNRKSKWIIIKPWWFILMILFDVIFKNRKNSIFILISNLIILLNL